MREYAKVAGTFWTGSTGRSLRDDRDAQVLAFYLMTSPHSNMIGLYYLPMPTLCHETGIPSKGASKALQRLSEGGFCTYASPFEAVFVTEMARFQVGESLSSKDNRHKAVVREWQKYAKTPLYMLFFERYEVAFSLPHASPFEGASKPLRSQEQEQEQEREREGDHDNDTEPPRRFVPPTIEQVAEFCRSSNLGFDPAKFVDYYTANGWRVGRSKMKDWHATARNWNRNEFNARGTSSPPPPATDPLAEQKAATRRLQEELAAKRKQCEEERAQAQKESLP